VFLTPALEPVFGGTYWPGPNTTSQTRLGARRADRLVDLGKASNVWRTQQARCLDSAKEITRQLREFAEEGTHTHQDGHEAEEDLEFELLEEAFKHFSSRYDSVHGGFSRAPKFPTPANLSFLLRLGMYPECRERHCWTRRVCACDGNGSKHLNQYRSRRIRDHIGNGFARYSVPKTGAYRISRRCC